MTDETGSRPLREPSLLCGALIGMAIGAALATALAVALSNQLGQSVASASFKILTASVGLGAYFGFQNALRRRKALGFVGPLDSLGAFILSWRGAAVAAISVLSAFALSLAVHYGFQAFRCPPG